MSTSNPTAATENTINWDQYKPKLEWLDVPKVTQDLLKPQGPVTATSYSPFRILSYNALAQTLIRRDLFPTSSQKALKWPFRRDTLSREVAVYQADIMCLQEVDFFNEFWMPNIVEKPELGYGDAHWTKKHGNRADGVATIWRKSKFALQAVKDLDYNELCCVEPYANGGQGSDLSEISRGNMGHIVALRCLPSPSNKEETSLQNGLVQESQPSEGVILFNAHLFWNPNYNYVRLVQIIVTLEQIIKFKKDHGLNWPVVMCGDWNHSSGDPSYEAIFERANLSQIWDKHECWLAPKLHYSKYQSWAVPPPKEVLDSEDPPPKSPQTELEKQARWALVARLLARLESLELPLPISCYKYYREADKSNPDYELTKQPSRFEPPITALGAWWCGPLDYIAVLAPNQPNATEHDTTHLIPQRFLRVPHMKEVGPPSDFIGGKISPLVQFPNDVRGSDHLPIMVEFQIVHRSTL